MRAGLPLDGLVVVAIEQAVAAPFCSSRLADAGARVIKVERPEGDFARGYDDVAAGGQSSYFVWLNRGKESVVVDLATDAGRQALGVLVAEADVLIQNLKPGALDRLGFGVETLCSQNPRLIACSISGYGETGPLAGRKAYDLLIQAESGLSSITGGPDEPARVGISMVDIATGATAHAAILEALIGRGITGRGADIRISMFDVMADWLTVPLLHQEGGRPPKRLGLAHPSIAPYGVFATRDGKRLLISIQSDREWVKFCTLFIGDAAAGKDPLFATNVARTKNRAETDALVARAFAGFDEDAAVARLTEADVAFASVNDMAALCAHPHLRRITVETPSGPVTFPAPAARIEGVERVYGAVPGLGTWQGVQPCRHRPPERPLAVRRRPIRAIPTVQPGASWPQWPKPPERSTETTPTRTGAASPMPWEIVMTASANGTVDVAHLKSWIGRVREGEDIVTRRILAEYDATLAPHLLPVAAGEAPPALHWCLAPETPRAEELGPDGHAAKGGFLPPVPLPRRMWAGGEVETRDTLREGDRVRRRETVRDVVLKEGRSGQLCFVTVDHEVMTARGLAIRERQDIVYREEAGRTDGPKPARGAPLKGATVWSVPATPTLLFRYSAMTFNGHRFHYDQPYATQVEGYADLVVHGPLQVSLLMNLAAVLLGRVPTRFTYRGKSPMTANQTFRVCGHRDAGGSFQGMTVDMKGTICMEASGS